MKIALATLLDDNFIIGLRIFIKSLLKNNPWFNYDFIVFDGGLSESGKKRILEFYDKIIIKKINKDNYKNVRWSKVNKLLKISVYKMENFRLYDYDRIVYMDVDMLVIGDISELFNFEGDIGGCRQYKTSLDGLAKNINAGVYVINKNLINEETYKGLIKASEYGYNMADQIPLNNYFRNRMTILPKMYNVEKRILHTKNCKDILKNARVIHYVGSKPWQLIKPNKQEMQYKELEDIWKSYL